MLNRSMPPATVYLDALNIAWWCGHPPQLRLPLALMARLLADGHEVRLYFDASARHRLMPEDAAIYDELLRHPERVIQVPSGRRADGEMLKHARRHGACIVSRDLFRDYRARYRKLIDDPVRLLPGFVKDEVLNVAGLGVNAVLPVNAQAAWQKLRPLLTSSTVAATENTGAAP